VNDGFRPIAVAGEPEQKMFLAIRQVSAMRPFDRN